jgi:uncharacterized protein (TIGR03437 family)
MDVAAKCLLVACVSLASGYGSTYYVSTSGSDSNRGTSDQPFRTIQSAVNLAMAGDIIIVRDGTYGHGSITHIGGDETGAMYPQTAIRNKSGTAGAYITIKAENKWGATLDCEYVSDASPGCDSVFKLTHSSYIVIQDFVITRAYWVGIYSAEQSSNIIVRGNRFEYIGNRITTTPIGIGGVFCGDGDHDWTFEGNVFHDIGRTGGGAFSHDQALYVFGQNHTIVNNIFHGPITGWGVQTARGFSGLIANNTFAFEMRNNGGHIMLWDINADVIIRNNIFYSPTGNYAINSYDLTVSGTCSIDHNMVYGGVIGAPAGCAIVDNLSADPGFVNAAAVPYDFRLKAGSPAIGAGVDMPAAGVDFNGSRRAPGAYDLGAYQYITGPSISAVANAASFSSAVVPGAMIAIFGAGLATSVESAQALPLPRKLGDTVITARCTPNAGERFDLPLLYVSPSQVNAQLPAECTGLNALEITAVVNDVAGSPYLTRLVRTAPGVFSVDASGQSKALVFDSEFRLLDSIQPGNPVVFYVTGLGPARTGDAPQSVTSLADPPRVYIGDSEAEVLWAGVAPGLAGLYQINAVPGEIRTDRMFIRSNRRAGEASDFGHTDAWQSNIVQIPLASGDNVENWSGSITAVYPVADSWATSFSPAVLAAKFSARFTIKPGARKFALAAVSEAGGSLIEFDPALGTFDAFVTVPAAENRNFQFGPGTEIIPMNFAFCLFSDFACDSWRFAGDTVPASRLDPSMLNVLNSLPLPNEAEYAGGGVRANALLHVTGAAPAGAEFIIDETHHPELSRFGGFLQIAPTPFQQVRPTDLKLFIDGRLIAVASTKYKLATLQ